MEKQKGDKEETVMLNQPETSLKGKRATDSSGFNSILTPLQLHL